MHFERVAGADPDKVAFALDVLKGMCTIFGYPLYSTEEVEEALKATMPEVDAMPVDGQERDVYVELTDYRTGERLTVCFGVRRLGPGVEA